jgi:putative spermidine/putrescine transport system ATP-binding protein/spermidine/putrescine transport system ATP-binding protein
MAANSGRSSSTGATSGATDAKVRIEGVTKEFGDVTAVDDMSFAIEDKEFLTLLGPSGAGKSTLLELIAGFVKPTAGEIYIDDNPISDKAPYERSIGMVFQSMALFPHKDVHDNIAFPLKMRRHDPSIIDDRVAEMLDLVELPGYEDRMPGELSGGQQQRVAIARALAFEPELLLLDEPLSSLDKKLRDTMREELLRIHEQTDVTTIHVTHNQEEALSMADRIAVVRGGQIEQLSPTQELYSQPQTPFIADFVGDSNMFEGRVESLDGDVASVAFTTGDLSINARVGADVSTGDTATVALRFEDISVGQSGLTHDAVHPGEITETVFLGDQILYTVDVADGISLKARQPHTKGEAVLNRGEEIEVGWNADDVMVFPT